jgi:uncharacterized MAPEG superfamily protein
MVDTLTALSQRTEAYWIGLGVFLIGVVTPQTLHIPNVGLSRSLVFIGGGILLVRLFVGVCRIFRTTAKAGKTGYREGKQLDE